MYVLEEASAWCANREMWHGSNCDPVFGSCTPVSRIMQACIYPWAMFASCMGLLTSNRNFQHFRWLCTLFSVTSSDSLSSSSFFSILRVMKEFENCLYILAKESIRRGCVVLVFPCMIACGLILWFDQYCTTFMPVHYKLDILKLHCCAEFDGLETGKFINSPDDSCF